MNNQIIKKINYSLIDTFLNAGKLSLELRDAGLKKEIKSDNTPVTNGDLEVNKILVKKIREITPDISIVSEESHENKLNVNLKDFWLIDPIDGTYDYVNNGDEFTLNAALIINKKPKIGIIYAPAKDRLFYSYDKGYSFELIKGKEVKLNCEKKSKQGQVKAVSYSDNLKSNIIEIHKKFGVTEFVKMKSSLKFCVIATGEYDFYVAEPRASEWDIAAGHAIIENAGGLVSDHNEKEIFYGKKNFKNPGIILRRSKNL
tara:strand:+ start:2481 stop:3254 length:774 start_codon:yes stop_codon:yes gene_type:complete